MKRHIASAAFLLVAAGSLAVLAQSKEVTLFDGSNLSNFDVVGNGNWKIAGDAVEATAGGPSFLVTKMPYGDFDLHVEFWVDDDANSGVFIRCANPKEITDKSCYEVNVYDKRPDPSYRTGAIVNFAKPMAMINAGGKWNTFEISARGPKLTVVLNGTKTVELEDKTYARGPIALQYGAGTVRFRNVRIRQ
jgi:hypothetical protein